MRHPLFVLVCVWCASLTVGCPGQVEDSCRGCLQYAPPAPDWCADGTVVQGAVDECGCQGPPRCEVDGGPSGCFGLSETDCRENMACEAIPYWGESLIACIVDERGFSDNCPYEGCRPAGAPCPTLDQLIEACDEYCSYNSFAIDTATGCRTCGCR